jgi:hypothetical protein
MCPDHKPARDGDPERDPNAAGQGDPASEDQQRNLENPLGEPPAWSYCQTGPRGTSRTYTGRVTYIGGAEGERLRRELAAVVRDLLQWAARRNRQPSEGGGGGDDPAQTG